MTVELISIPQEWMRQNVEKVLHTEYEGLESAPPFLTIKIYRNAMT